MSIKLYGYWRSSATYRVRIALNLKQMDYEIVPVHLVKEGGEQHSDAYRMLNPTGLVPTYHDDDEDVILNQSMAIIEYLDERHPEPVRLLPEHRLDRARVRATAQDIACDIQPLANLRVIRTLQHQLDCTEQQRQAWAQDWIKTGFASLEKKLVNTAADFCFGFSVSLADICLVPQVYNAKRFNVDMSAYPTIARVCEHCETLEAFQRARPENQPDAQ